MGVRVVNPRPVNRTRFRNQRRAHVTTRARGLQQIIAAWLVDFAAQVVEDEISGGVTKAAGDANDLALQRRLAEILRIYGLRQITDSGRSASGVTPLLGSDAVRDFMAGKDILVQNLADQTRDSIRGEIRTIITEALAESPRPSVGEISRRIRNTYLAPAVGEEAPFLVSSERAMLIARTELVQAENTGIVAGYEAVGIEEIEWLSFPPNSKMIRAGNPRDHWSMNGEHVPVGEMFITPLGNQMRYPGDPLAPIKETANCRCTVAPWRG